MLVVEKLKNLNNIHRDNRLRIYKRWFYNSSNDYHRICDYMQKINYSIQDLNSQIDELTEIQMKDVVFIIVLVDWIINSCNEIEKLINKQVLRKFAFNKENQLKSAKDYLKALLICCCTPAQYDTA